MTDHRHSMPLFDTINTGGVAEWLKAPVLKTGRGLVPLVGSNPTPTVLEVVVMAGPEANTGA